MSDYVSGGWAIMAWAWDQELESTRKLILLAIARHGDDNGYCWPTTARLGHFAGCAARTARWHVDELTKAGLLRRVERFRRPDGSFGGWLYQVTCCDPAASRPGWGLAYQRQPAATGYGNQRQSTGGHQRQPIAGQELSIGTTNSVSTDSRTTTRARAREGCPHCGGSGWKLVNKERNEVRRCECGVA